MEQYEIMEQSIMKNIQELSELCVEYGIINAYDLIDVVDLYGKMLEKAKANGGKVLVDLRESESEK